MATMIFSCLLAIVVTLIASLLPDESISSSILGDDHKQQGFTINPIPVKYLEAYAGLTKTIRTDLLTNPDKITNSTFTHANPVKGFKQRTDTHGKNTAKIWIIPATYPVELTESSDSNPWANDPNFVTIANFILETLTQTADQLNVPIPRRHFIVFNYYEPLDTFDFFNPVFPYHTDFQPLGFLASDGPTTIYDRKMGKWREINLGVNKSAPNYLIQSGALMKILSKNEYNSLPHGVGRSPVISDGLGKLSVIGILDLDANVDVTFTSANEEVTIKSAEYTRIRFKATYPTKTEKNSAIIPEGLDAECARLNDEPINREIYRKFIAQLNLFERPNKMNSII